MKAVGVSEVSAGYQYSVDKKISRLRQKLAEKQEQINAMDLAARALFSLFTGVAGGYKIDGDKLGGIHKGRMYLALDDPDIEKAKKVWAYSMAGIFYFENGIYNPPSTAWGNDGSALFSLVTADMIQANSITGEHIRANSITGDHIQAGTITGDKIRAGTITGDKLQADTVEANKLKSAGSNVYAKIGQAAVPSNAPGLALYDANDIIRALISATSGDLSLWVYSSSGGYPAGSSLTTRMDYAHLATGDRKTDIRLYQDAIYFRVNNQPHGANGATPTGQKPVFENGICIGFTT